MKKLLIAILLLGTWPLTYPMAQTKTLEILETRADTKVKKEKERVQDVENNRQKKRNCCILGISFLKRTCCCLPCCKDENL